MSEAAFFAAVRPLFGGKLKQSQVDGLNVLVDATAGLKTAYRAYLLATAQWETAHTMQPVRETLADTDASAVARLENSFKAGKLKGVRTPYWRKDVNGQAWFGRGYVQLTHKPNYIKAKALTGVDVVSDPSLAMRPDVAARILVQGSLDGMFTGKRLAAYLDGPVPDYVGARAVINGSNKASEIAKLARTYEVAFRLLDDRPAVQPVQSAYQIAKAWVGKHEVNDRTALMGFLRASGQSVDPKTTAWCAAFVNAALGEARQTGTGSLMARSFLKWGEATSTPVEGDIVVFERGKAPFGHVGFYVGRNADGSIRTLGGNQSDRVSIANYKSNVLGFRRAKTVAVPTPEPAQPKPLPIDLPAVEVPDPAPATQPTLLERLVMAFLAIFRR